jgi:hypothetical protein
VRVKALVGVLLVLLLLETGYIIATRHPIARFKPIDEDGYLAFDSATGQLCRTFRPVPKSSATTAAPTSLPSPQPNSGDPILNMIQNGKMDMQSADAGKTDFLRNLPACADVR